MNLLKYHLYSKSDLAKSVDNFSAIISEMIAPVLRDLTETHCESNWKLSFVAVCWAFPLCFVFDRVNYKHCSHFTKKVTWLYFQYEYYLLGILKKNEAVLEWNIMRYKRLNFNNLLFDTYCLNDDRKYIIIIIIIINAQIMLLKETIFVWSY